MLQIRNLRKQTDLIHARMHRFIRDNSPVQADMIADEIRALKDNVDQLCAKHGGSAADLGTPSFRQYLWLRFLTRREHLQTHLQGLHMVDRIIREQKSGVAHSASTIHLKIDYSGYLYQRKTAQDGTRLLIHEGFIQAPDTVMRQLITAAFAKRKTKTATQVKAFANSGNYLQVTHLVAGEPIASHISCKGSKFHLDAIFQTLNMQYFGEKLPMPRLVWSSARAQRRLGYYHPEIHTIAVNQKLDSNGIPRLLVEYILYHEMLHQQFGIEHRNGRRYAHTAAFHQAEKRFRGYQEAENLIKLLH